MPRYEEYHRRRNAGLCTQCGQPSATSKCWRCKGQSGPPSNDLDGGTVGLAIILVLFMLVLGLCETP